MATDDDELVIETSFMLYKQNDFLWTICVFIHLVILFVCIKYIIRHFEPIKTATYATVKLETKKTKMKLCNTVSYSSSLITENGDFLKETHLNK